MMKFRKYHFMFLLAVSLGFTACDDDSDVPVNGYIETTEEGSSTFILKGYEDASQGFSVFRLEGIDRPFYLKDKQFSGSAWSFATASMGPLSAMKDIPVDGAWQVTAEVSEGSNYWARCKASGKYTFLKMRVAYIQGNSVALEYAVAGTEEMDMSVNDNANPSTVPFANGLEIPALNADNFFAAHTTEESGVETLSLALEWNAQQKHSAWVAYSFDEVTNKGSLQREDAYAWDPKMPAEVTPIEEYMHKSDGFDKGHLCANADRQYSREANIKTFYYTNISPMLNEFNSGFWGKLEICVRNWGKSVPADYDKVYVVKGGTANRLLKNFNGKPVYNPAQYPKTDENGFTPKGLGCPQYYFMAVLTEKEGAYHALAFWVEHKEGQKKDPSVSEMQAVVVSIDKLEQETGIDFFCNLPDVIEEDVEASLNLSDWNWN